MAQSVLGVVVVTYNSGSEAVACLATLLASARATGLAMQVVVIDNASADDTIARITDWARGTVRSNLSPALAEAPAQGHAKGSVQGPSDPGSESPFPDDLPFIVPPLDGPVSLEIGAPGVVPAAGTDVIVVRVPDNRGFAGGVNLGLESLAAVPGIGHFWILNPDTVVPPEATAALAAWLQAPPVYGLMGGRVTYLGKPDEIQIDGGTINWRTGSTGNLNLGRLHTATPPPAAEEIDFVMGGSMVASRAFYDRAGPMEEAYFLYYEEVDWALRRGDLPIVVCEGLRVFHRAGTSIGSPGGGTKLSPLSLYFKHRGRMMFLRRFRLRALPAGALLTLVIAWRRLRRRDWPGAVATLAGGFGFPPPRSVSDRLGLAARARLRPRRPWARSSPSGGAGPQRDAGA